MAKAPIGHTCPQIDKYIKEIKFCIYKYHELDVMSEEDLLDTAKNMNAQLENCIEYLEDLRSSNDTLRSWGEDESERADKLEDEIYNLQETINP